MTIPSSVSESAAAPIPEPPAVHYAETAISYILRVGVVLSITLVTFGTILIFVHHWSDYVYHSRPIKEVTLVADPFPHTLTETIDRISHFRGQGFVILGLLVLLMTPVVSVTVSIFAFAIQKNKAFAIIAALVLAILLLSLILGRAEGGG